MTANVSRQSRIPSRIADVKPQTQSKLPHLNVSIDLLHLRETKTKTHETKGQLKRDMSSPFPRSSAHRERQQSTTSEQKSNLGINTLDSFVGCE